MFGYILILIMVLGAAGLAAVVWTYMKAQGVIGGKPHRRHRRRAGRHHSH